MKTLLDFMHKNGQTHSTVHFVAHTFADAAAFTAAVEVLDFHHSIISSTLDIASSSLKWRRPTTCKHFNKVANHRIIVSALDTHPNILLQGAARDCINIAFWVVQLDVPDGEDSAAGSGQAEFIGACSIHENVQVRLVSSGAHTLTLWTVLFIRHWTFSSQSPPCEMSLLSVSLRKNLLFYRASSSTHLWRPDFSKKLQEVICSVADPPALQKMCLSVLSELTAPGPRPARLTFGASIAGETLLAFQHL